MILLDYEWPGNVRQLQNVVRNIVVLHDGELVQPACCLPFESADPLRTPDGCAPPVLLSAESPIRPMWLGGKGDHRACHHSVCRKHSAGCILAGVEPVNHLSQAAGLGGRAAIAIDHPLVSSVNAHRLSSKRPNSSAPNSQLGCANEAGDSGA